eukprot:UN04112
MYYELLFEFVMTTLEEYTFSMDKDRIIRPNYISNPTFKSNTIQAIINKIHT